MDPVVNPRQRRSPCRGTDPKGSQVGNKPVAKGRPVNLRACHFVLHLLTTTYAGVLESSVAVTQTKSTSQLASPLASECSRLYTTVRPFPRNISASHEITLQTRPSSRKTTIGTVTYTNKQILIVRSYVFRTLAARNQGSRTSFHSSSTKTKIRGTSS